MKSLTTTDALRSLILRKKRSAWCEEKKLLMQLSIELHPVQVEHHSLSDGRLLVGQKVVPLATSR